MDIDDRFDDVDFSKEERYVFGAPKQTAGKRCQSFAESGLQLIPRDRWQHLAELAVQYKAGTEWLVTRIMDQGREGSCVGNATAQIGEQLQAATVGVDRVVPLSAISMYKQIGSSPSSGAMVDDALDKFRAVGMLPLDTPENRAKFGRDVMPHTGFHTDWPSATWKTTAKLFRADEFFVCRSTEEMFSCLLQGVPVVVGRQGHSIAYQTPRWVGGSWKIPYANSWSLDWGQALGTMTGGFGFDSVRAFEESADWCFGVTSMVSNGLQMAI